MSQAQIVRPTDVQLRARRSPRLIALGVLLVALGALGAVALYSLNVNSVPVVRVTTDVPRGTTLSAQDLAVAQVPPNLAQDAIPAAELEQLVSQTALYDLPEGSLPASRHIGPDTVPDGHSRVGLRLDPGRVPQSGLPVGSTIHIVSVESQSVVTGIVAGLATVDAASGTQLMDVFVPREDSAQVAVWSATNDIAVVALEGE